jgi:uncharacterized protein (DUF488 family)
VATIYTIGHGARRAESFVSLLKEAAIEELVDVRAYPGSRRHPQFSRQSLSASLEKAGIQYSWEGKALGGMRPSYADHMQTEEFQAAAQSLATRQRRACIMCAESNPADCHRSHIADWLAAQGHRIIHLLDSGRQQEHPGRLI